jgi:hypothetical protein
MAADKRTPRMIPMTKFWRLPVFLAGLCALGLQPVQANEFNSEFITYDLSDCLKLKRFADRVETVCFGDNDIPVWIITTRADHKTFVGYGQSGKQELAAHQTLPGAFSAQPLVEWRRSNANGEWRTFAAIQRWLTRDERGIRGETLVITKLDAGQSCHIAYIDAIVTPNVHARARFIADLCAPKFTCGQDTPMEIAGPQDEEQQKICTTTWVGSVAPLR